MFRKVIEIYKKIRKHGIIGSFKKAVHLLLWYYAFFCRFIKLIFIPRIVKKRILGIWDFKVLPWSIGDILVFMEMLSILKIKHETEQIDVAIVYDRENPAGYSSGPGNNLTPENVQDYMLEFLPLFSTCPYLGSVYQFNSREEFYRFLKINLQRYEVFPPLLQHLKETYNYDGGTPHLLDIKEFYKERGYIPHLRIGDRDRFWAQWFYKEHLPQKSIPVTLSLKKKLSVSERNADPTVWLSFIDKCKTNFPEVVFVIVGLREEVFEGLRERSNVIIAKDFGTSIMEDLALIRESLLYMGIASGVITIALFSDLAHLVFQIPIATLDRYGMKSADEFPFYKNKQRYFSSDVLMTPDFLFNKFKELYSKLDRDKWYSDTLKTAANKHTHPSIWVLDKEKLGISNMVKSKGNSK